jgi:thiamine transport system substrate-binding protein
VVLGIDQQLWNRVEKWVETWPKEWSPQGYEKISKDLKVANGFLPFDHGVFALMMDRQAMREQGRPIPERLLDLVRTEFTRRLILEDPRTSTPGLSFLLYTREVLQDAAWTFWEELRSQWLTISPSWDQAYALFMKKEAPLVWSYTTSQAYHAEHGDKEGRYQAILFAEGQPIQIEGAALVKSVDRTEAELRRSRQFLEFLLTPEIQKIIATKNWMLPVVSGVDLPASFKKLPKPKKLYRLQWPASRIDADLKQWSKIVERTGN